MIKRIKFLFLSLRLRKELRNSNKKIKTLSKKSLSVGILIDSKFNLNDSFVQNLAMNLELSKDRFDIAVFKKNNFTTTEINTWIEEFKKNNMKSDQKHFRNIFMNNKKKFHILPTYFMYRWEHYKSYPSQAVLTHSHKMSKNVVTQDIINSWRKDYNMKELKFIHITKCAGTTIENLGKNNNILWGRFHKEYGRWHEIFPNKSQKLKLKYDWFVIVRNPYECFISEFYCKWGGIGNRDNIDHINEKKFNLYIKKHILNRNHKGAHYTEQYKYIDQNIFIHIIKYENIEFEFNELMKKYKLDIVLNQKNNTSRHKKRFNVKSFTPEIIKLINKIYHKDFITFGYDKIKKK